MQKKRFMRAFLAAVLVVASAAGVVAVTASPAQAAYCYGASCNGQNPQGTCSGDGRTVGAMNVNLNGQNQGMIELR